MGAYSKKKRDVRASAFELGGVPSVRGDGAQRVGLESDLCCMRFLDMSDIGDALRGQESGSLCLESLGGLLCGRRRACGERALAARVGRILDLGCVGGPEGRRCGDQYQWRSWWRIGSNGEFCGVADWNRCGHESDFSADRHLDGVASVDQIGAQIGNGSFAGRIDSLARI